LKLQTLRAQLTFWYGAFLLLIVLVFGIVLYKALSRNLYKSVDQKLLALAEVVAESSIRNFLRPGFNNLSRFLEEFFGVPTAGQFIQVLDSSGKLGSSSQNLEHRRLPLSHFAMQRVVHGEMVFETFDDKPAPIRMLTYPVIVRGRMRNIVQVASSLETVDHALQNVKRMLALGIPSLLLVALWGGWFLAGRALNPMDSVVDAISNLDADSLDARIIEEKGTLEVRELARSFNALLGRLEDSFRRVKEFTADASHELRTPLTVLRGETEVALRKPRSTEEYQDVLASTLEEVHRMSRIVEDLLLLAKGDLGEAPVNKTSLDLNEVLGDIALQAQLVSETKNISVIFEEAPSIKIMADPLRIRQLFWNILNNAIKYTPQDGMIYISIKTENNENVKVAISDTGIGIPEQDLPHIFERFYRVDKHRARSQGGSGLGLAICKWITTAHGGKIEVHSNPGEGSVFTIVLPRVTEDEMQV